MTGGRVGDDWLDGESVFARKNHGFSPSLTDSVPFLIFSLSHPFPPFSLSPSLPDSVPFPSLSLSLAPSLSRLSVVVEEGGRERERKPLFSLSPSSSELPAGSELFYAVVVTGNFIRLEICTNQLSFRGSCQCVKLSGPAVRELPVGLSRGAKRPGKENEFKQRKRSSSLSSSHSEALSAPAESPSIFLDVEQQHAQNDTPHRAV